MRAILVVLAAGACAAGALAQREARPAPRYGIEATTQRTTVFAPDDKPGQGHQDITTTTVTGGTNTDSQWPLAQFESCWQAAPTELGASQTP